jgi:hypothetical protein
MFTNIFWLTIGFIFLTAIIGAIVARRRKDRCLKLVRDYHVSLSLTNGRVIWGDLNVFAQGLEVVYDAPFKTVQGPIKSSFLMYENEMGTLHAIFRYVGDLSEDEQRRRRQQVEARFRPGLFRRMGRTVQNIFNTIRDAFSQALGAFIGQVASAGQSSVVQTQRGQVEKIGQTLLAAAGNAYEPMLERHIGTPVVIELQSPADPAKRIVNLPGYLAEYSDRFVAVFNVEQPVRERFELACVDEVIDRSDLKVETLSDRIVVTNKAPVPLVVERLTTDAGDDRELQMVLPTGGTVRLPRRSGRVTLVMLRVLELDVVCPRTQAVVRHASMLELPEAAARMQLPPVHGEGEVAYK